MIVIVYERDIVLGGVLLAPSVIFTNGHRVHTKKQIFQQIISYYRYTVNDSECCMIEEKMSNFCFLFSISNTFSVI